MNFDEWVATVPVAMTDEVIWKVQAFRLALYLAACVEVDTRGMGEDKRFAPTVGQLIKAAGSVSANIAEGYPRQSARDRVRYYEYALGSAAEVKVWYLNAHLAMTGDILADRFAVLRSISRLLQKMINSSRHPTPGQYSRFNSGRLTRQNCGSSFPFALHLPSIADSPSQHQSFQHPWIQHRRLALPASTRDTILEPHARPAPFRPPSNVRNK